MPTIKSMDGMVRYLEDAGFEVTKEYFSSSRRYLFAIKKYQFERSEYFTYPEKDGTDKHKIMKDFCDQLIETFYSNLGYARGGPGRDMEKGITNQAVAYFRPTITKVIFNDPATIVFWSDGSKTVVKTQNGETYDPEKGLAMAMAKRAFGNKGNYYNIIRKWVDKYREDHPAVEETVLYFDNKPVVTLIAEKTYPIRSNENCARCRWGVNNDCSKYKHCEGCPHTVDNAYRILFISCKCSLVNDGDPCPYFEDLENEMDENKA